MVGEVEFSPFYAGSVAPAQAIDLPITWRGSVNFAPGRGGYGIRAFVLHTAVGTLAGMRNHFNNPNAQVSAHYGVGLDGQIDQYVQTYDTAWANGILEPGNRWPYDQAVNPNKLTISCETEDNGKPDLEPVTDAQYKSVLGLVLFCKQRYKIELIATHRAISPKSRTCPAGRWIGTGRIHRLAQDSQLELLL